MYKNLFNTAISLIFKPSEAWRVLNEKDTNDNESFLSGYVYPFIGMITLAAFVGALLTRKELDFQVALKAAILVLVSFFCSFFISTYIINELWHTFFHRERNMKRCQCFVGYSSSLMYALYIILSLLPEFFFLRILVLYTVYIIWEGAIPYMGVSESEQLKFVSISTIVIVLTPLIIEFTMGSLMPGLKL